MRSAYEALNNLVALKVPESAGAYELRYVINQDRRVIAKIDLTVE